jgi:hypothetical protein
MPGPTLLLVASTAVTPWERDVIRRLSEQARKRGFSLLGADTPENLRSALPEEMSQVDETVPLDVHDIHACRSWAAAHLGEFDAVATIRELSVLPTAWMAKELGLPGNAPEAVLRIRRKDLCRERLREVGLPQPRTARCHDLQEAEKFLRDCGAGPWVVKPRDGLAGIGVTVVHRAEELPGAVAKFSELPAVMDPLGPPDSFLVETYVEGQEYSAEGVMVGGEPQVLTLTRKGKGDGFLETSHRVPSGLPEARAAEAREAVARALTAVGITRGIFHVEFWNTPNGIVLGELHDRGGGDYIHALVEYSRPGLELYGMFLDDLLGRPPAPAPPATRSGRAEFVLPSAGRLVAVQGWDEVARHPAVLTSHLDCSPGDRLPPPTDSYTRPAVFVVGGDTAEEADALARDLASRVAFAVADHEV